MNLKYSLIKLLLIILFLVCLLDMPYGYFQIVRIVGMLSFLYLGFNAYERNQREWKYFFWGSAVLINPILKISLGRGIWNIIDVFWAGVLAYSIWVNAKSKK